MTSNDMPLSEHEQRILDEIERRLAEEDPKFARDVSAATPRGQSVRRLKRAVAGFALGFALLIAGLLVAEKNAIILLGIGAFAVMLVSAISIAATAKAMSREHAERDKTQKWFGRMEERWRKRFDKDEN